MILISTFLFILLESTIEGLLLRFGKLLWLFKGWLQWVIAALLFAVWFVIVLHFDDYIGETWKLITGFIFVRFLIFDVAINIARGVRWNYYGTTKLYDRIMTKLGSWGWWMKIVCGLVGIVFLMGWN